MTIHDLAEYEILNEHRVEDVQSDGFILRHKKSGPRDWATSDTAAGERAVLKNVKDGDIVLLHDMTVSSVQAALDIVDVLKDQSYEIVTVSELVKLRGVNLKPGKTYTSFPAEMK